MTKKLVWIYFVVFSMLLTACGNQKPKDNILTAVNHSFSDIVTVSVSNDEMEQIEILKSDYTFLKD